MMRSRVALMFALLIVPMTTVAQGADVWQTTSWEKCSPEEAGLDAARLSQARDYALTGGGSGYITRGGKLVFAWATKSSDTISSRLQNRLELRYWV